MPILPTAKAFEKKERRTLWAHPEQSLFKYLPVWSPSNRTELPRPKSFYSFDYPEERILYPVGLNQEMRLKWIGFLKAVPADVLPFFGFTLPKYVIDQVGKKKIQIQYVKNDIMTERFKYACDKYRDGTISKIAIEVLGCNIIVAPVSLSEKIGVSPKYHAKLSEFNGLVGCVEWFSKPKHRFQERGLLKLKVYDNRCYHEDNKVAEYSAAELFGEVTNGGIILPFKDAQKQNTFIRVS